MSKISYSLTKSKITTGLRCPKKLWFDINEKIEIDPFLFHKGNVFGEKITEIYGDGLDLSNNFEDDVIQLTNDAMNDPKVNIIYEGAFLFEETLVRTDALIRKNNGWKLIEAKSSQSLQEHHLQDIAIQYYVLNNLNVLITEATIAHINKDFIYEGKNDYKDLIVEVEVLDNIQQFVTSVPNWIKDLLPVTKKVTEPIFDMGDHCKGCQYIEKCKSNSFLGKIEIPISILPQYGNKLQKQWFDNKIYDLRDLPYESVESIKDKRWNFFMRY